MRSAIYYTVILDIPGIVMCFLARRPFLNFNLVPKKKRPYPRGQKRRPLKYTAGDGGLNHEQARVIIIATAGAGAVLAVDKYPRAMTRINTGTMCMCARVQLQ
jgi:hypothetical protein